MAHRTLSRQSFNVKRTSVNSAASATKLLDVDSSRTGFSIYNKSTAILTIIMADSDADGAAGIAAGDETVEVAAGGYFEGVGDWVGQVWGIWASANGAAKITAYR